MRTARTENDTKNEMKTKCKVNSEEKFCKLFIEKINSEEKIEHDFVMIWSCVVWLCLALFWLGLALLGLAWLGFAWLGLAWL